MAGALAAEGDGADPPRQAVLARAVICEGIEAYEPVNAAIVFSISLGEVSFFTEFDPVRKETHIFHKWFFRDRLTTRKKLTLKPPRWATFSRIQLRQADKGPWRVETVDKNGRLIDVRRFSITD
jgi:Protein of unknown function (DUF2914)